MTSALASLAEILGIDISVLGKSPADGIAKAHRLSSNESALGSRPKEIEASENGFPRRRISIRATGGAPVGAPEGERRASVHAVLAAVGPRTKSLRLRVGMEAGHRVVVGALSDFVKGGDHE